MSLNKIRNEIDRIDKRLVELINKRTRLAINIGEEKRKKGVEVFVPDRERKVYENVRRENQGPLSKEAMGSIYREIMSAALSLQYPLSIAYSGHPDTFTHLAAIKKFGTQVTYIPVRSISSVFTEVETGRAGYGVVPVENSFGGVVPRTLDMFIESNLKICSEVTGDRRGNVTRFLVIGPTPSRPTGHDRTSIMFSISGRIGALYSMLVPFKKHRINMTRIESRPSRLKHRDYFFFIDLEGHFEDRDVKNALDELEDHCHTLKILGSYPREI